jgi:hypothetical protein
MFDVNNMVYCNQGGKITAGGFLIDSPSLNQELLGGAKHTIHNKLKDLAIPAGLACESDKRGKSDNEVYNNEVYNNEVYNNEVYNNEVESSKVIPDDLYNRLLSLADDNRKQTQVKKNTRRNNKDKNNKNKKSKQTKKRK